MNAASDVLYIAYDCDLDRPGCVIVAAGLGADSDLPQLFPAESWITHLTPGMKVYPVTDEQLDVLIARAERACCPEGSER